MSNPMLPNSFSTPNLYIDKLLPLLKPEEYVVLSYAARRIFGFQKRTDCISLSQFVGGITSTRTGEKLDGGTGLSLSTVRRAVTTLKKFGILLEVRAFSRIQNRASEYRLQEDANAIDWVGLAARRPSGLAEPPALAEHSHVSEQATPSPTTRPDPPAPVEHTPVSSLNTTKDSIKTVIKTEIKTDRGSAFKKKELEDSRQPGPEQTAQWHKASGSCLKLLGANEGRWGVSAATREQITKLLADFGPAWVETACERAAQRNARSLLYVQGILQHWRRHGFDCRCPTPKAERPGMVRQSSDNSHCPSLENYRQPDGNLDLEGWKADLKRYHARFEGSRPGG